MFSTKVNASKNYSQDWSKYNQAQVHEKEDFLTLLFELCAAIDQPRQQTGRPRLSLRDIVFGTVYKVYSTKSARRFMSDLEQACRDGFIGRVPHFNAFSNYLLNVEVAWLLTRLAEISSLPLAEHESEFAVDSTGLSTDRYARWVDEKEMEHQKREWHKLHIMCARRSKVVTAVAVTPSREADGPLLGELLEITSRNFKVLQVTADGAYYSNTNILKVTRVGGVPYFLIPSPSLPRDGRLTSACNLVLHLYGRDRLNFFKNYYKRNNVETAFSMIRATLGTNLRSTSIVAQYNEAICKVICHNLRVLGRAMHEEGVSPTFETVSSYVTRVEEAARSLAETISGGRIVLPRKGRGRVSSKPELIISERSREQSSGNSLRPGGRSRKARVASPPGGDSLNEQLTLFEKE